MFQHQGIWLPDGEKHFPEWMTRNGEMVDGRGTYQIKKFRAAMEFVRNFRVAVDVGGHVGLWSVQLMKRFRSTVAFEPVEAFRACFLMNMRPTMANAVEYLKNGVELHACALGATEGKVRMAINPADSGGTHVEDYAADAPTPIRTLDSFGLECVDFLKIDCEGYEFQVLAGAKDTLTRCRPTVIVEQKQHKLGPNFGIKGVPAVDLLREMGWAMVREMSGDYIMVPK